MMEITILILLIVEAYAWMKYRDLICPAVLHNIMWIIAASFSTQYIVGENMHFMAFAIIIIGSIVFQIGFTLALKVTIKSKKSFKFSYRIKIDKKKMKLLIIILLVVAVPIVFQYLQYIRSSNDSIYSLLTSTDENLSLPSMFDYFRKIVQFLAISFLIGYWMSDKEKRKNIRGYIVSLAIIAILAVASVPTRNGILFFLLPLIMAYLATHKTNNIKIISIGVIAIIGFMGVFYIISLGKYWYLYKNTSSAITILLNEISTYLSGGIVAFGKEVINHSYIYNGKNSFRFFMAIWDKIFNTSTAVKLVNEFTRLPNGATTNVYTFYDFYIRDFGWLYAIIAQFIVGIIHGISYKGMKKKNPLQIYYFSMLSYPLIMQFFQDQYISLLSTWIQIIIVGLIVYKSRIFIISEKSREIF